MLYGGRVVEQAAVADLFQRPMHPYTKGLLASIPSPRRARTNGACPTSPVEYRTWSDLPPAAFFRRAVRLAEARCAEPQPLRSDQGQQVACWKFEQLVDRPWPVQRGSAQTKVAATPSATLEIDGLRKDTSWPGSGHGAAGPEGRLPAPGRRAEDLRAVDSVSLQIAPGETLGLVGESGCGKTTLGRCVVGLINPTAGEIRLDHRPTARMTGRERQRYRKDVQMIFQNPGRR